MKTCQKSGKHLIARRLSERLAGLFEVKHLDGVFTCDPKSARRYQVFDVHPDETCYILDDSLDMPIGRQISSELRRVAALLLSQADQVDARLAPRVA